MTTRRSALVLLASACLLLPACGEDPDPVRVETVVLLPRVSDAEKVRFALERILKGPLPRTDRFAIPKIHSLNIEHARADLEALGPETASALSDPGLIARLTRPDGDHNPWHNVLAVLPELPDLPAAVVIAWTAPALGAGDLPLDRRAITALLEIPDDEVAATLLLRFLESRPRDRELAPRAVRSLVRRGSPWREQALGIALRLGAGPLWDAIPGLLAASPGDPSALDALAGWALLAEASGPSLARKTTRNVVVPWWPGRLVVDDAVWPEDPVELEAALRDARVLAPAYALDGGGFLVESTDTSPVLAWRQMLTSGLTSAAEARCRLATAGHAPYEAAVARDVEGSDPEVQRIGAQCIGAGDGEDALEISHAVLDAFLDDLAAGLEPLSTEIQTALNRVLVALPEEGADYARRILVAARPGGTYQVLLELCHDLLRRADPDGLRAEVIRFARSDDLGDRAVGLLLIRRGRDPAYAEVVRVLLDGADPAEVPTLRRLLIWLHSDVKQVQPAALEAFVRLYAGWIASSSDSEAQTIASGLLDLGAPGAAAYAAGLRGPQRHLFVRGLLGRPGLVPLPVAAALLEPVDASTPTAERHAVLVAAYRSAPSAAAPLLATVRARLAPAVRNETDDVLEVLRHRAER